MSRQRGIKANEELLSFFGRCRDGNVRLVKISIENEELSLAEYSGPNSDSWEMDYETLITPLLEEQQPCYVLFRLDTKDNAGYHWLLFIWSPDNSPVRLKMQYASAKATLKNDFGQSQIKEEVFVSQMEEATWEGYLKMKRAKERNFMVSKKDAGMQCETHPIPSNIVESYTWNEWELRRRGIILSKINKCRTHGTQTYLQALRKTAECQTYPKISQEMQTNTNVHTSVPRTKYFFAGLRGYNCEMPPHIVELTSENPEDLHCICKPMEKVDKNALLEQTDKRKRREQRKSIGLQQNP